MNSIQAVLELDQVAKTYVMGDQPVHALRGVSLSIQRNEYVAIMGPSGSGKSTLMNIIGCLDTPSAGRYLLEGEDVGSMSDRKLAEVRNRRIGFVFQTFNLLARSTVQSNVELPLVYAGVSRPERRRRASDVIAKVGLAERSRHRPNELSGGQRPGNGHSLALVGEPSILLADEPTGNLDTTTGEEIMALFEALHDAGQTIVLVTHEDAIAARARRIVRLRDGVIERDERRA